jgi:predicted nucleic acid-binding protein
MNGRLLVDTNVLVYAYDRSEPKKQKLARSLIERLTDRRDVLLTAQVLGEFFRVTTTRLAAPLTPREAGAQVAAFTGLWPIAPVTHEVVLEAIRGVETHQMSYWDAQLWACARLQGASFLLSEDFQDGHSVEAIRFVNPFRKGFDLSVLD